MKKDEIFGEIMYDELWKGFTQISMFDEVYKVSLDIYGEEDAEIDFIQKEAFVKFTEKMPEIMRQVESHIFKYYLQNIEDYRAMRTSIDDADKVAPKISTIEELKKLVIPLSILIQYDFGDDIRRIGILCDCTWETEHGLGIKIENEKVVETGLQDIVL
ncbi:hypothetical protein SAMN06265349_1021027 [Flavobacterium resistens]|uniref:DUF6985 domain-containing protein n=1 Tax=Flavobacterium resistens TaxID=443612 RepID=A0A521CXP5_9FLAO|nr:hypothetical protein [Flavobacterium resistens]MRX67093.1 hypothetical protein [Flavobacterium resistens]SMO64217.1 hypothetical protein SAMN06265349_1021027 [Flavobacterium resistens]